MAIEQASAYINEMGISFSQYLSEWNNQHADTIDWHSESSMEYKNSIFNTWKLTYNGLSDEARKMLHRLSWFAADPIPDFMLDVAFGEYEPLQLRKAYAELKRFSMLTHFSIEEKSYFRVHRLVQDVTRHWQEKENNEEELWEALWWIDVAYISGAGDVRNWPVLEPLTSHALALADFAHSKKYS